MRLRFFLFFSIAVILHGHTQQNLRIHPDLVPLLDPALAPFYHGVASGDPTQDAVIIWSRITLPNTVTSTEVSWQMATDERFKQVVKTGTLVTDAAHDFTLKTDVTGLMPDTRYYYRFRYGKTWSPTGVTHTLSHAPSEFTIAFGSCSNYEWGYFNNYRFMAQDSTIDLVVHLGDYIYEYAPGKYGDTTLGRINVPAKEIVTLDDYRTRYSLYRLDKDLQLVHRMKPFITTWDDHEIANNGYLDGAQNHQPQEGEWSVRKSAGKQAYYEWLPVRDNAYHELWRSFSGGKLFDLLILDTRIAGRTRQVDNEQDKQYRDTTRTILGKAQRDWLFAHLRDNTSGWKIIANQVPFGPLYQTSDDGRKRKYMDGWDGYPYEREQLISCIDTEANGSVVFITGDYHSSFALENDREATASTDDNVSVEFVVTSITSANDDEYVSEGEAMSHRDQYLAFNPHMKYVNNTDNGYLVLTIKPDQVIASYCYASTVRSPRATLRTEKTFRVKRNKPTLVSD